MAMFSFTSMASVYFDVVYEYSLLKYTTVKPAYYGLQAFGPATNPRKAKN